MQQNKDDHDNYDNYDKMFELLKETKKKKMKILHNGIIHTIVVIIALIPTSVIGRATSFFAARVSLFFQLGQH